MSVLNDAKYILTSSHFIIKDKKKDISVERDKFIQDFMLPNKLKSNKTPAYIICDNRIVQCQNMYEENVSISEAELLKFKTVLSSVVPSVLAYIDGQHVVQEEAKAENKEEGEVSWDEPKDESWVKKMLGLSHSN